MTARKTPAPKKSAHRIPRGSEALKKLEPDLPDSLKDYSRQVRSGLAKLERQIETAQRGATRRWTRLLRDVSHGLGQLEALGDKQWKKQTYAARREAVKLLKRLEKAIEPPKSRPRKKKAQTAKAKPRAPRSTPSPGPS